ncbi:hypothetical protein [Sphaerochaeta sp.]|uniref:hypothetical protein n=1 Tax=Sphaerochaeta sp. TaxID=1972642 RepID=UPI003D10C72C
MNTTTSTILLTGGSDFFLLTDAAKTPVEQSSVLSMKSGYNLIIDDTSFFYTGMEFPQAPKRKTDMFIRNYLASQFPAELSSNFAYMKKGDNFLICMLKPDLTIKKDIMTVLNKAGRITSPMAIRYGTADTFVHTYADTSIQSEEGIITHIEKQGQNSPKPTQVPSSSALTVPFVKAPKATLGEYKTPVIALVLCYVLFVLGLWFRYEYHDNKVQRAQAMLNRIYQQAKVADTPNPYGMLKSKAEKAGGGASFETLAILEKISRAQAERITATSIDIRNRSVVYEGTTSDYAFIEDFRKQLKKETGKEINLIDTKKQDGDITFTLRFQQ